MMLAVRSWGSTTSGPSIPLLTGFSVVTRIKCCLTWLAQGRRFLWQFDPEFSQEIFCPLMFVMKYVAPWLARDDVTIGRWRMYV